MNIRHLTVADFSSRLGSPGALLLDVRRRAAFTRDPRGIPGAIPVYLDDEPVRIPDTDRRRPVSVYCVCDGQASSVRLAMWLQRSGYTEVAVLEGGLPAWRAAGLDLAPVDPGPRAACKWQDAPSLTTEAERPIAEQSWLAGVSLPARRQLAVLFVDIVDSTGLIETQDPQRAFEAIERLMSIVVAVGVAHCGDVRDFEGDGALLYFAGTGEALPAAFAIRDRIARARAQGESIPEVRMGLAAGELLAGYVGNRVRRSLLLVGPAVHAAARLQKIAHAGQIATTREVLDRAARSDPSLVARFELLDSAVHLKGFRQPVSVWVC